MSLFHLRLFFLFPLLVASRNVYENCSFVTPPDSKSPLLLYPIDTHDVYTIMELDPSTDARCLDGTNFKFNYSYGSGSGKKKFVIDMLGGAFCGMDTGNPFLEACLSRTKAYVGSSRFLPANNTNFTATEPMGYMSNIEKYNPRFWNWNKIGINYCDGSNHQGFSREPYEVNGTNLWFRGYNNTMAVLEWAKAHMGLFDAEDIILAGESAGGQAVYFWLSYLRDYFPSEIKLRGIAEAGFFLDFYNPYQNCNLFGYFIQQCAIYTKSNETDLFRSCSHRNTSEDWKCLIPEYIFQDIHVPVFIINSQNDFEALRSQTAMVCLANGSETCSEGDKMIIRKYRMRFLKRMFEIKNSKTYWGFWIRSCFEHIYFRSWAWYSELLPAYNAETNTYGQLREELSKWYDDLEKGGTESHTFIDLEEWEEHCPGNFFRLRKPLNEDPNFDFDPSG